MSHKQKSNPVVHVICCNDAIMGAVIDGTTDDLQAEMERIIVEDYQRRKHAYENGVAYLNLLHWHTRDVVAVSPCAQENIEPERNGSSFSM